MTTFARQIVLALCLFTAASTVRAAEDNSLNQLKTFVTTRYSAQSPAMKDYVEFTVAGFQGHAYRLADDVTRTDSNQPGVLMFDQTFHLVAIGFARPTAGGVEVMSLADFNIRHVALATNVATR